MDLEPGFFVRLPHNQHETRIFEASLDEYLKNNARDGYWGKVTATIDWCERQYLVSHYIAEFWNCVSNIFYILIALWGLLIVFGRGHEKRHALLFFGFLTIGFGSALYHGTLLFHFQILDELPMLISIFTLIWSCLCIDPVTERNNKKLFEFLGDLVTLTFVCFCYLHWTYQFVKFFQALFGICTLASIALVIREIRKPAAIDEVEGRKLGYAYAIFILLAVICWLADQIFCVHLLQIPYHAQLPFLQLHSWWHFFTAMSCLSAGLFLMVRRAWYFREEPKLVWTFGILPYIVRGKTAKFK